MAETPLVEKVARAIYSVTAEPEHGETWEELPEVWRDNLRLHARVAIHAMRKPTEAMSDAGWAVSEAADKDWKSCTPRQLWTAMPDAALAAPDEGRET